MDHDELILKTVLYVKDCLKDAEAGHDWWHIMRVLANARIIAAEESGDQLTIELAALLHDIADRKFHHGDEELGPRLAGDFLRSLQLPVSIIQAVIQIIQQMSFGSGDRGMAVKTIELQIVQDADRLDAMGAIGIARAFHYGGYKNRAIYDPAILPDPEQTKEAYKKSSAPTINHFYEKLLLLKDLFNTSTGKRLAGKRHEFMETYLQEFFSEWNTG